MKLLALLPLLSVVLAAPTRELTSNQWNEIQSGFFENVKSLSTWTWGKAEQAVEEMMMPITTSDDDEDRSVWEILKGDPHSFSRLVKIIEVSNPAPVTPSFISDLGLKDIWLIEDSLSKRLSSTLMIRISSLPSL